MADDIHEFDPTTDPQVHTLDREDTMLYRKATDDSDEHAVFDIWGEKLETRVVDAKSDEFGHLLNEGWVRSPLDLGVGGVTVTISDPDPVISPGSSEAQVAAEKLAQELGETVKTLTTERDQAIIERDAANERAKALEDDLSAEKALRQASAEHITRLEAEAKERKQGAKAKPTA